MMVAIHLECSAKKNSSEVDHDGKGLVTRNRECSGHEDVMLCSVFGEPTRCSLDLISIRHISFGP